MELEYKIPFSEHVSIIEIFQWLNNNNIKFATYNETEPIQMTFGISGMPSEHIVIKNTVIIFVNKEDRMLFLMRWA
jgi:hypothetical protein